MELLWVACRAFYRNEKNEPLHLPIDSVEGLFFKHMLRQGLPPLPSKERTTSKILWGVVRQVQSLALTVLCMRYIRSTLVGEPWRSQTLQDALRGRSVQIAILAALKIMWFQV